MTNDDGTPGDIEQFEFQVALQQMLDYQFVGIDWCKGSGMVRGDIISRNGNVIEVRFKTVSFSSIRLL